VDLLGEVVPESDLVDGRELAPEPVGVRLLAHRQSSSVPSGSMPAVVRLDELRR